MWLLESHMKNRLHFSLLTYSLQCILVQVSFVHIAVVQQQNTVCLQTHSCSQLFPLRGSTEVWVTETNLSGFRFLLPDWTCFVFLSLQIRVCIKLQLKLHIHTQLPFNQHYSELITTNVFYPLFSDSFHFHINDKGYMQMLLLKVTFLPVNMWQEKDWQHHANI